MALLYYPKLIQTVYVTLLSVSLLCYSNGTDNKIAGICLSVCLCLCVFHRSYGRNFE